MTMAFDIGTLIDRDSENQGARPRIAGTDITVRQVVVCHKSGMTEREIHAHFGNLSMAQVHAALAHYYANQKPLDTIWGTATD